MQLIKVVKLSRLKTNGYPLLIFLIINYTSVCIIYLLTISAKLDALTAREGLWGFLVLRDAQFLLHFS
jgi:hypothetical protein